MIGHLLHSYMRSIGRVLPVLWITIFGSTVRILSTLLLIPHFQMDGVYLGLILSWTADGALSAIVYFKLYHTKERIQKIIDELRTRLP